MSCNALIELEDGTTPEAVAIMGPPPPAASSGVAPTRRLRPVERAGIPPRPALPRLATAPQEDSAAPRPLTPWEEEEAPAIANLHRTSVHDTAIIRSAPHLLTGLGHTLDSDAPIPLPAGLQAMDGARAGHRFVIAGSGGCIGRDADCDVILPDPGVKSRHALVHATTGGHELIDLSNGQTRVNGEVYARTRLHSGDRIEIGGVALQYVAGRDPALPQLVGAIARDARQRRRRVHLRSLMALGACISGLAVSVLMLWP